jgi:hypothetical protein
MESLFFEIAGVRIALLLNVCPILITLFQTTFEFTPNAQIWPRSQNAQLGGQEGKIYIIVSDLGTQSGQGLDFISM